MNLLTQNSDLKKTGIYSWTLPAHIVKLNNGSNFNTCPNAGICAGFCYAKNGTYNFSNVKKSHIEKLELVLFNREKWIEMMNTELSKSKYVGKHIRIHDAGDFFSADYFNDWLTICRNNPTVNFYAYTKEVKLVKEHTDIPDNFTAIYSYGGRQDNLIDKETDRHSDVFSNYDEMIAQGYIDIEEDDKLAATSQNHKIGLYRNNIPHFIKKMKGKNFSNYNQN
jgi:hypothetical protein